MPPACKASALSMLSPQARAESMTVRNFPPREFVRVRTEVVVALDQRLEDEGVGQRCRQEESGIRYRMRMV